MSDTENPEEEPEEQTVGFFNPETKTIVIAGGDDGNESA